MANLDVALEGAQLTVSLQLPLDSLLGFERAPRNAAERQAAAQALARLRDAAAVFRIDPAAACRAEPPDIVAPVLGLPAASGAGFGPAPLADGHAELEALYVFQCAQPAQLRTLELALFHTLPRLQRVDVQASLPHGQRRAVLRRQAAVLPLAR